MAENPDFVQQNLNDLCASIQFTVVEILIAKLKKAAADLKIKQIAVAGGVSANSALRQTLVDLGKKHKYDVFIPPFSYTTDNAAMIAMTGFFKYADGDFCSLANTPYSRVSSQL